MVGVWRSLLWKEWREQRWKAIALLAAAGVALATTFLQVTFRQEMLGRGTWAAIGALATFSLFSFPAASLFIGAGIAAGEQSQRTLGFLQGLPVSSRRSAIAKLLVGLASLWFPICLVAVALPLLDLRPFNDGFADPLATFLYVGFLYGAACSSLLLWVAAVGVRLSNEVMAGAVGFLVIAVAWALFFVFLDTGGPYVSSAFEEVIIGCLPGGVWHLAVREFSESYGISFLPGLASAAVFSNGVMAAAYILQFGRTASKRQQADVESTKRKEARWLAPPWRSTWTAILWKQLRESLPLALLGAGAVTSISFLIAAASRRSFKGLLNEHLVQMIIPVWIAVGSLVAIVAGIGLWMEDVRPGLNYFWRSRPIPPNQWFFVKTAISVLLTLIALALPTVMVLLLVFRIEETPAYLTRALGEWHSVVAIGLLVQWACFCVAAALMAIIRRPMVAALCAVAVGGIFSFAMSLLGLGVVGSGVLIAAISLNALAACWLSIRHDWEFGR